MYALIDATTQEKIREAGETTHLISEDQSWLPIVREDRPPFDPDTQDAVRVERVDGLRWLKTWEVVELDPEGKKRVQRGKLNREQNAVFSPESMVDVVAALAKESRTPQDDRLIADFLADYDNLESHRADIEAGNSPDVTQGWRQRQ